MKWNFAIRLAPSRARLCIRVPFNTRFPSRAREQAVSGSFASSPAPHALVAVALVCLLASACSHEESPALESHAKLFTGMGAIHHPISTKNQDTQKYFDQGLALIYAFNFGEAVNSFKHGADLDPDAAMLYWGMALANAPNYNSTTLSPDRERAGFDFIQTAAGLEPRAPEAERAYIDALERAFTDDPNPDRPKLARDYSDAMREVYRGYPDDADAAALFAASLMNLNPWHLWKIDGKPGPDTPEIVTVLEDALRRWPQHTGVNHFYIHTMEGSPDPGRALPSADRLASLAPAAGHLVHMPSHIYLRTGDYAAAVKSNRQAVAADREYRRQQPVEPPGAMGYANHDQHFLAVAASMDGEFETALSAAKEIQSHVHNEAMASMYTLVLLRFSKWDEILAAPAPDTSLKGVTFLWHLARGCAQAGKGQLKESVDEQSAMERAFSALPAGRAFGIFFNEWSTLHSLAADELAARIAAAGGNLSAAIAHWRHAVSVEDQMNFDDVPDWYYPVRESLGAALLRNKQPAEAEQVFRQDLKRNPNNPRSLFGLCSALETQHKSKPAAEVRQSFEAAWKGKQQPRLEDL